jgi:hypothetical protein
VNEKNQFPDHYPGHGFPFSPKKVPFLFCSLFPEKHNRHNKKDFNKKWGKLQYEE